jgi:hypothetical protein
MRNEMKVVFIAKTNLNTDGRILNQLRILSDAYPNLRVELLLLPDKKTNIQLPTNVNLTEVKCAFRNHKITRFLTVIEWTVKSLRLMNKIKPEVIHVQDSAVVIPVFLYKALFRHNTKIIYDDHELPNENEPFSKKLINFIEESLMQKADYVVSANEERMHYLNDVLKINSPSAFFLNIPHFEDPDSILNSDESSKVEMLKAEISEGTRFVIHQGPLYEERGKKELARFSQSMTKPYKFLLLGGTLQGFNSFLQEFSLDREKFFFVGSVNYTALPKFWSFGVASVVLYLPTYLNNRLCAPNRFYLSLYYNMPVIVNKANPVLANFVQRYKCGDFIEELTGSVFNPQDKSDDLKCKVLELLDVEKNKLIGIYDSLLK